MLQYPACWPWIRKKRVQGFTLKRDYNMAQVKRIYNGNVLITEISIVELMSLSSIMDLQMKEASKELSEASERLEKKLVEWNARPKI